MQEPSGRTSLANIHARQGWPPLATGTIIAASRLGLIEKARSSTPGAGRAWPLPVALLGRRTNRPQLSIAEVLKYQPRRNEHG